MIIEKLIIAAWGASVALWVVSAAANLTHTCFYLTTMGLIK